MEEINVRQVRKRLDYTQEQFARVMDVSPRTLWSWEHGIEVPNDKAVQMLNLLQQYEQDVKIAGVRKIRKEEAEPDPDKEIPLLPVSAIGGSLSGDDIGVMPYECERILSPIREAELAIRVSGDSMYPRYPNGSMVFVRKWDASRYIDYGKYYVLNTTNGTIIKQVRKGEGETLRCVSVNQDYDPYDIPKSEVRAMYVVLGCLHLE